MNFTNKKKLYEEYTLESYNEFCKIMEYTKLLNAPFEIPEIYVVGDKAAEKSRFVSLAVGVALHGDDGNVELQRPLEVRVLTKGMSKTTRLSAKRDEVTNVGDDAKELTVAELVALI